jgi:DNA processing protein
MPLVDWLRLSLTDGIGPILARRLIEATGSPAAAVTANEALLRTIDGIGTTKAMSLASALKKSAIEAEDELQRAEDAGSRIICPDDEEYSLPLKEIPDPPLVLYVRGSIEPRDLNAVAIVGSRKCSLYGKEQSERFGALLAGAGFTVVSGGARGIDTAAHRGAMSHANGRTIAVLGCGIDLVYPPENGELFDRIAEHGGAVLSEYPIGTPPLAENFPKRNRIVSGWSRGVLVIEADERSGALITARQAGVDQGRALFALPGRVDNKLSIGPHQLIRDGATLVTNLQDIVDDLGPLPDSVMLEMPVETAEPAPAGAPVQPTLFSGSEVQQTILNAMTNDPSTIDQLIDRTGLEASVILRELTVMSLKAVVRRGVGQTFHRP